jgi:short-subunit dehydrogenase
VGYPVAGRRILLTGASSGIGRALARELAARGAALAVAARREGLLRELAGEIEREGGSRPAVLASDLSKRGAAAELARRATAELGRVDVLVNNAGGGVGGTQWAVGDHDAAREAFEVNFWSPVALTAALVPPMRERRSGAVVNVTSMAQVTTMWAMGHYLASKAALARATEALRLELTGSGVHVLEVIPGPVDTAVQAETRLVPGAGEVLDRAPLGDAPALARLAVRALERGRPRVIYPRPMRALYALPLIDRWYMPRQARRVADRIDTEDARVIRSGSMGDDVAREARAAWEREHARS